MYVSVWNQSCYLQIMFPLIRLITCRWSIYKWLFPGKRMVDNRAPTTIASPAGGTTGLLADEKAGECEVNEIRRRAEHHPPTPGQTPAATTDETPGQTPAAAPSPGSRGSRRISWFGHRGSVQPQAAATTQVCIGHSCYKRLLLKGIILKHGLVFLSYNTVWTINKNPTLDTLLIYINIFMPMPVRLCH